MQKVLIANRGAIAVRIIRTLRQLEIASVAVYSDADRSALHVQLSDEAYHIGPSEAAQSYLNAKKIIQVAKQVGADAIHPGYGFMSESAEFAKAVADAGLIFMGPSDKVISLLGDKAQAKAIAMVSNVPMVPGHGGPLTSENVATIVSEIGLPVVLKAVAGGGGKGMRIVRDLGNVLSALQRAQSEAMSAFGSDHVMVEKYLEGPKHVEIQVCRDSHGNCVHLFERECSVQRRYQKVIEEAPCPTLSNELRQQMCEAAIRLFNATDYVGIGTVEFMLNGDEFYFLEVNTRIQVEHGITEAITGVDLVSWQVAIARGEELPLTQSEIAIDGHAIELRVIAEDAEQGFMPAAGPITVFKSPKGYKVRLDSGVGQGDEVSPYYDSLLCKLIVHGEDRLATIRRMLAAIREFHISGIPTTLQFAPWVLKHPLFLDGTYGTKMIEQEFTTSVAQVSTLAAEVASVVAAMERGGAFSRTKVEWNKNAAWNSRRFDD